MSSTDHDVSPSHLLELSGGDRHGVCKQPRFSYTRDFLCSLKELDICKKLPAGFDASLLSEFDDALDNSLSQSRSVGGFYLQSSKRTEYGHMQTNRSEGLGNYSRANQGKWETRSSGSSDREDLQTDRESSSQDFGKRNFSQPRHVWKLSDGLLGKPSGYSGQASSQRSRGNGSYTLNKSTEPYQPPRPYKSITHPWRDNSDSINDETFGSSEYSEDRAEEERRRKASFELMRKEQYKAFHDNSVDLGTLTSKVGDTKLVPSQNDSSRVTQTQSSAARPRVPPGFKSSTAVKNVSAPPADTPFAPEVEKSETPVVPLPIRNSSEATGIQSCLENGGASTGTICSNDDSLPLSNVVGEMQSSSPMIKSSETHSYEASNSSQAESWMDTSVHSDFTNIQTRSTMHLGSASQVDSISILDKLFQSVSKQTSGGSSSFVEDAKMDEDAWSHSPILSSKFSDWFLEEKTKPEEKSSQEDVLSQKLNNGKVTDENTVSIEPKEAAVENTISGSSISVSNEKVTDIISSKFSFESNMPPQKTDDVNSKIGQIPEAFYSAGKSETCPSVLTCEDLEQFIMEEAKASSASVNLPQFGPLDAKSDSSAHENDYASQHLLSLLNVGTIQKDVTSHLCAQNFMLDSFDKESAIENSFVDKSSCGSSSKVSTIENPATLEGLFGAAFMKELQSTDAPLSAQTGSSGGSSTEAGASTPALSFSHSSNHVDNAVSLNKAYTCYASKNASELAIHDPLARSCIMHDAWTSRQPPQMDNLMSAIGRSGGFADIQLPEYQNYGSTGETFNNTIPPNAFYVGNATRHDKQLSRKPSDDVNGKLEAFGSVFHNERMPKVPGQDGSLRTHGSYDMVASDPFCQQLLGPRPQNFHQISRPVTFQHLRDHGNLHYDVHRQLPPSMYRTQSFQSVAPQFDSSVRLPLAADAPPVHRNLSLHDLNGYPRGAVASHPTNRIPNMPVMNPMHNFPMAHIEPAHGDFGMEISGRMGVGSNHPEVLERLFQMDLREASQSHLLATRYAHGSPGPEVDLGFRY